MFIMFDNGTKILNYQSGYIILRKNEENKKIEIAHIERACFKEEEVGILGGFYSAERAQQILVEIMKKASLGCDTYIIPEV